MPSKNRFFLLSSVFSVVQSLDLDLELDAMFACNSPQRLGSCTN